MIASPIGDVQPSGAMYGNYPDQAPTYDMATRLPMPNRNPNTGPTQWVAGVGAIHNPWAGYARRDGADFYPGPVSHVPMGAHAPEIPKVSRALDQVFRPATCPSCGAEANGVSTTTLIIALLAVFLLARR